MVVTATPITCFNDADGSIKIVLRDSVNYKGVTVQFVLKQQIGGVFQTVDSRAKGLPYNTTFSNLAAGTYQIETNTRPTIVPGCGPGATVITSPNLFVPSPAGSFAGYEQYLCDSTYTIMGADDPAPAGAPVSTGKWTLVTGPSTPTFSDDTDPYAIVSGLMAGDYTFRWTVSKPGCADRFSDVTIRKRNTPVANAGSDTSVCALPSIPLQGNNLGSLYFGTWSQTSGPNSSLIADPSTNNTTSSGLVAGVYRYQWIIQDDIYACFPDTDEVVFTNNVAPTAFTANVSPNPVCEGKPVAFGLSPILATNTYTWSGPGGFSFIHTGAQSLPSIASVASSDAGSYAVVAQTSQGCNSSSVSAGNLVVNPKPPKALITPSANPVCEGTTLTLIASGALPITWTLPNGSSSNTNPLSVANMQASNTGKYKVFATSGSCSSDGDSVNITLTPVTTPSVSQSGTGTYCSGTGFTLTAAPTIATATYTWTTPSGGTVTGQTLIVSSAAAIDGGTYSVKITDNSCTGPAATTNVTISPSPAQPSTITGNATVCQGDNNVGYSVTSVGGVTYIWSYTGTGVSVANSGASATLNFSASATSGALNVTAVAAACSSAVRSLAITVSPKPSSPTPSSNSPVCAGQTINLSAPIVAGATYDWSGPNGFTSTSDSPSISTATAANAGSYSVSVAVGGCASDPGSLTVNVNPVFTSTLSSNSPICAGATLNLAATTVAGATYAWTGPNGFTSAIQNPTIASATTAASGTYSVIATVASCAGAATTTSVTVNAVPAQPSSITGKTPVCPGESNVPYSVSAVGGVTYMWSYSGSGATITGTTNSITVSYGVSATSGTLSVNAVLGTCTSTVQTQAIVINPIPASPIISSSSPVCAGSTLNLTASTIVGATYDWTGPNGFTSTLQNPSIPSVTAAAAGTYSVTAMVGGCASLASSTGVTISLVPTASASNNGPICEGGTLSLTASTVAGASYAWTGPNSFSSSIQNPSISSVTTTEAGIYSLIATQSGCASAPTISNVTINPTPAQPSSITGKNPVCGGETNVPYSVTAVGGVSYIWTYSGTGAIITGSTNSVTVNFAAIATSGTLQVTAILGACSSAVQTQAITLNPVPAIPSITSNSPVCAGFTLTLTTPTVAGATYAWSGPGGFTSALQNPIIPSVTTANAGTYNVTITVANCSSLAGSATVVVTPLPTTPIASSNSPVCSGSTLNLFATAVVGATYAWTGPNGFSSSSQNPSIGAVTASEAGTYNVTASVSGCTSASTSTTVTINTSPSAPTASSNNPLCVTSTLNLTASTIAGATYNWTGPNGFTSAVQNPTVANVTSADAGTYSVTSTVGGCTSVAGNTNVVVNTQPAAPTASSNSPVCAGGTLSLSTSTVAGAIYAWTGPSGFTSALQNPSIPSVTTAASGTYSVTTTVANCTSLPGNTTVTITTLPISPVTSSNSPVCEGATLNLSVTNVAGATYAWTGPNGFASNVQNPSIVAVSPAATGTYSVTATLSGCSSAPVTTSVVVNPLPATPVASSNSPLCVTSTLNLTATTIAGATYDWTGPNGFTSAQQNPNISSVATVNAGVYSVSATLNGCQGAVGSTSVVVNTQPAAPTVSSNSPVCEGTTLTLSTPTLAGATYAWTGPNGFTSSLQNPTITSVTAAAAGSYTVIATVSGCNSLPGSTTVTVTPFPTTPSASSNSPICAGSTLNLSASTVSGATYAWIGPNGFVSILQNPNVTGTTVADAGTYSVTAIVGTCSSLPDTTNVTINPIPATPTASSNSPVCAGSTLNLASSAIAGATYSWTGPNGFTANSQSPSLALTTTAAAGSYSVFATLAGCPSAASSTTVSITPIPAQPSTITGNDTVCQGVNGINYSVTNVSGVTFVWDYTGTGASITSTANTASIDYGFAATSGNLTVAATVGACSSAVRIIPIILNPIPAAPTASSNTPICAGSDLNLTATPLAGATYAWTGPNSFSSSIQNPTLVSATTAESGTYNLTATVGGCTSAVNTTNVVVNNTPSQPGAISGSASVCQTQSNILYSVPAVGGLTYTWSYSGTGATIFVSSVNTVRLSFSATATSGTLSVRAVAGACTSTVRTQAILVNPSPKQPILLRSNSPLCVGQDLDLAVAPDSDPSVSFSWTLPDNSTFIGTDFLLPNVGVSDQGNYLVTAFSGGCLSPVLTIPVSIIPGFAPLPTSNSPICAGSNLIVGSAGALPPGATYSWTGPNGFTSSTQIFSIGAAQVSDSGTYTVVAHVGTCSSAPVSTQVRINPIPAAPGTISGDTAVCQGLSKVYTIAGAPGINYNWTYTGSGAIFPSGNTGNPITINFATTATSGTLQVVRVANACSSSFSNLAIKLNARPTTPASKTTLSACQGDTINLTATIVAGATYAWTGPSSFASSFRNPSVSNVTAANGGIYLVTYSLNGCQGDTDTTDVTVNPVPNANFSYARNSFCQSEANVAPTSVPAGSSFLASPSGLSLNSATGSITFGTSIAGSYTIVNTVSNGFGCQDSASFSLTVLTAPKARTFTYPSPICDASSTTVLPSFTSLGNSGVFQSTSGLNINASTGAVTPNASTSGTYQVVYLSVAGTCKDSTISSVTISPSPTKPNLAGSSVLCQGGTATLTASSPGFSSFAWYKDGSLVQPTGASFNASVAGQYYVNVTATNGCGSVNSDTLTLGINTRPAVPVIDGVCTVSAPPATLSTQYSALAGYSYTWFRNDITAGTSATLIASTAGMYKTFVTETATGCSSDTSVSVDPFGTGVAISIITGSNPFCSIDSVRLGSNSPSGNVWTLNGSPLSATATALVKISGQVILTVTNGTCSGTDTLNLISTPSPLKPTISSVSDSLCAGDSLGLTTVVSGTIQWTLGGVSITGANTATLKVGQAGAYRVRVSNGTCSAISDAKIIGLRLTPTKPLLNLSGAQQICQGDSLGLSITNFLAGRDQWYLSQVAIAAPKGTGSQIFASSSGVYKVRRTSTGGCVAVSDSVQLIVNPTIAPTVKLNSSDTAAKCEDISKRYTATVTNAGSPTYQWFVNNKLVATSAAVIIDTLSKTSTIKVIVTTSSTCASPRRVSDSIVSKVVNRFKVQTTVNPIGCASPNGAIIFAVTGGSGNYLFAGDLTKDSNLVNVPKTYTTSIFDQNTECLLDTAIIMNKAVKFKLNAAFTNATCANKNGVIVVTTTPLTGPFKSIGGTLKLGTNSSLAAGIYTASLRDTSSGCVVDTSFTLMADGLFTTAIGITQPDCGSNNGAVTITASPGPISGYTFFGDFNKAVNNNVAPGVYIVTTDNGKCPKNDTITINGKALFNILATIVQPNCVSPIGSIKLATAPKVSFQVSGSLSDSVNNNLAVGVYKVRLTDNATGCFKDSNYTLIQKRDFTASFTQKAPLCFGKDGEIDIKMSPDTAFYQITGNLVVGTNKNLDAGAYTFRAKRVSSSCILDTTVNLVAPGRFTTALSVVQPDCGSTNGSIQITPSPAGTYTYSGDLTQALTSNLGPNTYITTVTNTSGCAKKDTVELLGKPTFAILATVVQPSCAGNGSIRLRTSPKIDFSVSIDLTDSVNTNLAEGIYKIRITDKATLCKKDTVITLNKVVPFKVAATTVQPSCRLDNGAIFLGVTPGPNSNYTFALGVNKDTSRLLTAGTYPIRITEKTTGCRKDTTIELVSKADFTLTASLVKPFCNAADGEIDLFISPSPNSLYFFEGDLTSDITKNLTSGNYSVKVTDKTTTCVLDTTLTLGNRTDFAVTATLTDAGCNKTDGSISLSINPGPASNYDFTGNFTSSVLSNVSAGKYKAIITKKGAATCFKDTTFVLKTATPFTVAVAIVQPSCNKSDGSISLSPNGANYTYSGDLTKAVTTGLRADTFAVNIKDVTTGCDVDTSFILKNQVDFKVTTSMLKPLCGLANGRIALLITPTPISNYTFGGAFTTDTLKNLAAGNYKAIITRKGSTCAKDTTIVLGNTTPFTVSATITAPTCGKTDGKIKLRVSQGVSANYTFGGAFTSDSLVNIGANNYRALVTSKATGCTKDTSFSILAQPDFTIVSGKVVPSCNKSDGAILLAITPGPSSNYTITGALTKDTTRNLPAGTYTFKVQGKSTTCTRDTTIVLSVPSPKVDLGNGDTLCNDLSVTLKAKLTDSLNVAYKYTWLGAKDTLAANQSTNTLSVLPKISTIYKVYVSNGNGCPGVDSVKMSKPTRFYLENTTYDFTDDSKIELHLLVTDPAALNSDKIYILRKTSDALSDWRRIDSIPKTNTIYVDRPGAKGVYYYKIYYPGKNVCGEVLETQFQRTVMLNATASSDLDKLSAFLNWTTFSGWDTTVFEYQVWRSLDNGEFVYYKSGNLDTLASYVNGTDGAKQCYKIRAVENKINGQESWSNTVCLDFNLGIGIFNIFTPNGDGHNDTFFFKNIQYYPNNEVTVFNRWGNKVFHQVGYANEWDGGDLPAGTYFYVLDLKDGKTKPIYGDVLLHR